MSFNIDQLPWIKTAKSYMGLKEIPGIKHNQTILTWLKNLKAWWSDDEQAWCGTYVGECFRANGMIYPKMWMRAKDWGTWGIMLPKPIPGCVVVFERKGGGHVGFYMGETTDGYLEILGGNQGNAVSYAKFSTERVLRNDNGIIVGYRWPSEYPLPVNVSTDKLVSKSTVSTNEA